MSSLRKGHLDENDIMDIINFDISDIEDEGSDEECDLQLGDHDQCEAIPPIIEEDWNESDEEPLASFAVEPQSSRGDRVRWKHTENFGFTPEEDQLNVSFDPSVCVKSPYEYFSQYIDNSLFETMSECTNIGSVLRTGKSLNTTSNELKQFFGCSMAMSIFGLPRLRMYWGLETRVNFIANTMTRNRFFQLRSNLKLVNDEAVDQTAREIDKFWKIRPLVSGIEKGCRENERDKHVAIDEQIIPFTGKCKQKQVVKAAAGWVLYREHAAKSGLQRKDISQYLDFKLDLAKHLIYSEPTVSLPQYLSPQTHAHVLLPLFVYDNAPPSKSVVGSI
ncbi:piggyBac transposable element-derived protein 3-like [Amyelois transitella]|uniref:piggyBac transposable element-derived protein 3-like n=1 Tax=Amyelois transitella TaxID=680683 RepID=UPI00298F95F9|nr:piggyBac transposable element-derived protein 3-like [Amyelois transitella]